MITKTLEAVRDHIDNLLSEHEPQIEQAMRQNDGHISVALKIDIDQEGPHSSVDVSINYVEKRTKENKRFVVSEQPELFGQCELIKGGEL